MGDVTDTEPRTEAGRRLVVEWFRGDHFTVATFSERIGLIEAEARSTPSLDEFRAALLKECDDARNTGIRPSRPDELRAWNFVVDHFEQFVRNWKAGDA